MVFLWSSYGFPMVLPSNTIPIQRWTYFFLTNLPPPRWRSASAGRSPWARIHGFSWEFSHRISQKNVWCVLFNHDWLMVFGKLFYLFESHQKSIFKKQYNITRLHVLLMRCLVTSQSPQNIKHLCWVDLCIDFCTIFWVPLASIWTVPGRASAWSTHRWYCWRSPSINTSATEKGFQCGLSSSKLKSTQTLTWVVGRFSQNGLFKIHNDSYPQCCFCQFISTVFLVNWHTYRKITIFHGKIHEFFYDHGFNNQPTNC